MAVLYIKPMFARSLRPPISAKWIRIAAALLEAGMLAMMGAMFLAGVVQDPNSTIEAHLPIRVGLSFAPVLVVTMAYAMQRIVRPYRYAFVFAGALVCALGAALRADLDVLSRLADALRGFLVGAIVTGVLMNLDDEGTALLEGGAQPWREMFLGLLLATFGIFPAVIWGGFVLALPTIMVGMGFLIRCIRYDARLVVPQKSVGAAFRVFLAMSFTLLALGLLVVCPMISLGIKRLH